MDVAFLFASLSKDVVGASSFSISEEGAEESCESDMDVKNVKFKKKKQGKYWKRKRE